jgi:hypothetical protein
MNVYLYKQIVSEFTINIQSERPILDVEWKCIWINTSNVVELVVVVHIIDDPHLQTSTPMIFFGGSGDMINMVYQQKFKTRDTLQYYILNGLDRGKYNTNERKWYILFIQRRARCVLRLGVETLNIYS